MVRTRADAGATRAVGAKAPRKNLGGPSHLNNSNADKPKGRETGGNSYCPRETPEWQKPITSFFNRPRNSEESSGPEPRRELVAGDLAASSSNSGQATSEADKID